MEERGSISAVAGVRQGKKIWKFFADFAIGLTSYTSKESLKIIEEKSKLLSPVDIKLISAGNEPAVKWNLDVNGAEGDVAVDK